MMYLKLGTRSIVLTTIYLIALLSLAASQLDSAHGQVVDQRNRQVKSSDKIDSPASNGVKSESVTLSKSTPDHKESNGDTFSPPDPNGAHASISPSANVYTIEGKVSGPPGLDLDTDSAWLVQTRVIVNYGERVSHLKKDGSFEVHNLQSGSYVVEVANPTYFYEAQRVDINSKGKIRARKVNYIQASAVNQLNYPLKFRPKGPFKYFHARETWRITDFLFNPMVIMMVLPLLLIMVLPKMINVGDDQTQREMQQNMQMPKVDMPELSEMMTNLFTGNGASNNKIQPASGSGSGSNSNSRSSKSNKRK